MHARRRATGATGLRGSPITVYANGTQIWTFCHGEDMMEPMTGRDCGLPGTIEYFRSLL